ncbi:MAG: hypothetical protein CMD22_02380 [Flavobacteriales bacterium]|nr:hypothetical protein [Flavobacteriales bacterium]|tara:strand:+ start:3059 stop:3553 length:495 start_codon:yes stop_codon:yes gene_type:complete
MKKSLSILSLFLLSSCGFYSFTGASISPNVKTYSVKYFQNKANTVNASLSNSFTEKLKDYFSTQTNLQQMDMDGDLSFEGNITSYTIKPIAIKANETARQNRLTIKIEVSFINKFDEKLSFNSSFSRYKDFPAEEDLSSVEDIYMEQICDEIVEDVFNKSVVNW